MIRSNDMKWDDIKVFQACLVHHTLSGAAEALSLQQSTVSRRIQALESLLEGALFIRTSTGVTPTPLALKLATHATAMEEHMLALERIAHGHEPAARGHVRVALIEPVALYMLLPHMDALKSMYPELQVELLTGYEFADLTRLEADIALRFARPSSGDLIAKRLMTMPLNVLMSQVYLREHGMPSLQQGRWVNVTLPHFTTPEAAWYETHVTVDPWLQTNSYVLATEAITSGSCVGMTTAIVERMPEYELLPLELSVPLPQPLELWLVTHQSLRHVPRIDAVWSWLEKVMTAHME